MKKDRGITLISLVITIIILLILSGIVIKKLTEENSIILRARQAKDNTIDSQNKENKILNNYEEKIDELTNKDKIDSLEKMLTNCGIKQKYTEEQIFKNEDDVLNIILKNKESTEYLINNKLDKICDSEEAMEIIGNSSYAFEKIMDSKELFEKIINSNYIKKFEKNSQKVPQLNSNSEKGYIIEGIAADTIGMQLYKAFDYEKNTTWLDTYYSDNIYGDGTITIEFPQSSKIYHIYYYIENIWAGNYLPQSYKIYGINGEKEDLISEGTIGVQEKDIYFYNNIGYKKYKLVFEKGNQGTGASEISIYYR